MTTISSNLNEGESIQYRWPSLTTMTTEVKFADQIVALSNFSDEVNEGASYSLAPQLCELALDNCATHHICAQKGLFVSLETPTQPIVVQGVSGRSLTEGIGTIAFTITDDNGVTHDITLDRVIYLSSSPKNLISVSQWEKGKQDDCCVTSRQTFTVVTWGHDFGKKYIFHRPN